MKNAELAQASLEATYQQIATSRDARGFFTHLDAYLSLIRTNKELLDLLEAEAAKEKAHHNQKRIGYDDEKLTRFWFWWEELSTYLEIHRKYDELLRGHAEDPGIEKDATGAAVTVWFHEDLENIFRNNSDTGNLKFKRITYRNYVDGTHLKIGQWLREAQQVVGIDLARLKVRPGDYSPKTATLGLMGVPIRIQLHKKGLGDANQETVEAHLMRLLFNPVKVKNGVEFYQVLRTTKPKMDIQREQSIKKVRNYVAVINSKISDGGGPDNLITISQTSVYVNSLYL